jgi:hypothetical protein
LPVKIASSVLVVKFFRDSPAISGEREPIKKTSQDYRQPQNILIGKGSKKLYCRAAV